MAIYPPSTPRSTALPAPGSTPSSLPTPRRKSFIAVGPSSLHFSRTGGEELSSLRDAVRSNNPTRYDSPDLGLSTRGGSDGMDSPTPTNFNTGPLSPSSLQAPRKVVRRAVSTARLGASTSRPTTPAVSTMPAPRTPAMRSKTPTGFGSSTSARFPPPASPVLSRTTKLSVGDSVTIDVGGQTMGGVLRFVGEVEGKDGSWGGVELEDEWAGKGKNDGSVKGTQYFACPPLCGLFLPLSKITARPTTRKERTFSSTSASSDGVARGITAGSRASKYLGMTAKELAQKRLVDATPTTPKRPASPEKAALGKSTLGKSTSAMSTPRAARPRPSISGSTFTTPRKSIGGAGLPRPNLGSTLKRPPSALRSSVAPSVPPVPTHAFSGTRSVTPSSATGRATPSTPGRRMSTATNESSLLSLSRPATPSVRSYSRQSFASSISRLSNHSFLDDAEESRRLAEDLRETTEREKEVRKLLEGSERLGREMEDKLADKDDEIKSLYKKLRGVEEEREVDRAAEAQRVAGLGDEEVEKDRERSRVGLLEARIVELEMKESEMATTATRISSESESKLAARERELEGLRERTEATAQEVAEEQLDLKRQIDNLRSAGQALCETYEERIADIETSRLEALEVVDALTAEIARTASSHDLGSASSSPSDRYSTRSDTTGHTSAADVIDAENDKADLEHLRAKVENLEELLEETKMHLEAEVEDTKRRRQKSGEVELVLKKEIKTLKETIERSTRGETRLTARIDELEEALVESQTALESERLEVENLRQDVSTTSSSLATSDELKRANKTLATLRSERSATLSELEEARREMIRNAELVGELREDLRNAEKELSKSHIRPSDNIDTFNTLGSPTLTPSLDASRRDRFSTLRLASSPSSPSASLSNDPNPPNLFPSPSGRRDSATSSGSRRSAGGKDEGAAMRESIIGLKVIVGTLEEENKELSEANKVLVKDARELKAAQRSLEATVENLMTEMNSQSNSSTTPTTTRERVASQMLLSPSIGSGLQKEVDELKVQLADATRKSEKIVAGLNQEVTELESLIESKIYREDELESELERYKKMAGVPSSSRGGGNGEEEECEMCGELGHDLEACPIFGGSAATPSVTRTSPSKVMQQKNGTDFCDDCEEFGHSLEDCPLANDIF